MRKIVNKLKNNELILGSWITLAHPAIAEIMSSMGFDYLTIDLEHSVITIREAEELIRIIELKGISPLVRLTSNDPNQIKRVMDAGAHGVIVPMINNKEQAEAAVKAVKYPPVGKRGVGLARAQGYGMNFKEYAGSINEESVVIVQIEHVDAINNIEEILKVAGINGTIIGPYDLSASIGKPGKFDDEEVIKMLNKYESTSKAMKKPMGFHVIDPDHKIVQNKISNGYKIIAFSTDFLFLSNACKEQMSNLMR